mgnify:CR=1 FL=1
MKKTILISIFFIFTFTGISFSADITYDCENPKGFHEKMMCKKFNLSLPEGSGKTSTILNKTKGKSSSILKKLKTSNLKDLIFGTN